MEVDGVPYLMVAVAVGDGGDDGVVGDDGGGDDDGAHFDFDDVAPLFAVVDGDSTVGDSWLLLVGD